MRALILAILTFLVARDVAAAPQQTASLHTIKELETDISGFSGKRVCIQATIDVANYYNYAYRDGATILFCFKVRDATGSGYIYYPKDKGQALRAYLLKNGPQRGTFEIDFPKDLTDPGQSEVLAVLFSWSALTPVQ